MTLLIRILKLNILILIEVNFFFRSLSTFTVLRSLSFNSYRFSYRRFRVSCRLSTFSGRNWIGTELVCIFRWNYKCIHFSFFRLPHLSSTTVFNFDSTPKFSSVRSHNQTSQFNLFQKLTRTTTYCP